MFLLKLRLWMKSKHSNETVTMNRKGEKHKSWFTVMTKHLLNFILLSFVILFYCCEHSFKISWFFYFSEIISRAFICLDLVYAMHGNISFCQILRHFGQTYFWVRAFSCKESQKIYFKKQFWYFFNHFFTVRQDKEN